MPQASEATAQKVAYTLDPVTFEVLKNAFKTTVDQMGEQLLKTCHSFVIYNRDFSNVLLDRDGLTVMHGSQDLTGHLGTQHFSAQAIIETFAGDMHPGDIYCVNDPYSGGTHFNDVRLMCPIFAGEELIGFTQSCGHWADVGGSVPGSYDILARDHFGEAIRITPTRVCDQGRWLNDVIEMIASNTRAPEDVKGDLRAQVEATRVGEREILRLVERYGLDTVVTAFEEVQNYAETLTRQRIASLPDGEWEATDYVDSDPGLGEEKLIPVRVRMKIEGDEVFYDLSGSHPAIGSFFNSAFGGSHCGVYAGTKMFVPEVPLNEGFYRPINVELGPEGSIVHSAWPVAVSGFGTGAFEKIVNSTFELWSRVMPERAIACGYNMEYLLSGGRDGRREDRPIYMWYDWLAGGWGARNGRDGASAVMPVFGVGLTLQPMEGQERLSPVTITEHNMLPDSGGPGEWRGGLGVLKGAVLGEADGAVLSYASDRARSVTWGLEGGLPSLPQGVWHERGEDKRFLGVAFSNEPLQSGDYFWRGLAGGGGYGDPLRRDPEHVLEDVIEGYVTVRRARIDYGVVLDVVDEEMAEYTIDEEGTRRERKTIAASRRDWLREDPESVAERYRSGELDQLDLVRWYGVILDWGTGELLAKSTKTFREMLEQRAAQHWADPTG